ncbi:MAG: hypothetical protein ACPL7O_04660, partial [Armatimonadota bacterium]
MTKNDAGKTCRTKLDLITKEIVTMQGGHVGGPEKEKSLSKKSIALAGILAIIAIRVVILTYLGKCIDVAALPIGKRIPIVDLASLAGEQTNTMSLRNSPTNVLIFSASCPH